MWLCRWVVWVLLANAVSLLSVLLFAVWADRSVVSRCKAIFDLSEQSINPDLSVSLSLSLYFTLPLNLKCSFFVTQCFYFIGCSVVRHGSPLLPNGCCIVGHTNSSGPTPQKCKKTPFFLSTSHSSVSFKLFQMILVLVFETKPFHISIFQYAVSQTKHSFIYLQFYIDSCKLFSCQTFEI